MRTASALHPFVLKPCVFHQGMRPTVERADVAENRSSSSHHERPAGHSGSADRQGGTCRSTGAPLARGGLPAIEITLRTAAALDAIRAVAMKCRKPSSAQVRSSMRSNMKTLPRPVPASSSAPRDEIYRRRCKRQRRSPSSCRHHARRNAGAARGRLYASEILPAGTGWRRAFLKALSSPLAGTFFCPTGGISLANARTWSAPAERALRRRLVGCAQGTGGSRQLERHHRSCKGCSRAESLISPHCKSAKGRNGPFSCMIWWSIGFGELRHGQEGDGVAAELAGAGARQITTLETGSVNHGRGRAQRIIAQDRARHGNRAGNRLGGHGDFRARHDSRPYHRARGLDGALPYDVRPWLWCAPRYPQSYQ